MSEQIFNKLVRDKIPEIILADNRQPVTRILDDVEFKSELEKKLLEEYREVLAATDSNDRVEELADIIEVFSALVRLGGKTLDDVLSVADEKRRKHGGFEDKIFLIKNVDK